LNACIIFNPSARGGKARRFRRHLAELSRHCTLKPTQAVGDGRRLAAEAVREGFDTIVAAGGDGTVNEVVNGLADEPGGLERGRLGVLPLGTVNVFAKELRLPARVQAAWQVIEAGREQRMDLGEAEFMADGRPVRRCFAQMAGAGVDTRAIELVDWGQKQRVGALAYWVSGFQALRGAKPSVVVSDGTQSLTGEQVLIGNGRFYGGRLVVFPEANSNDGLLEVTVIPRATLAALARGVMGLALRRLYTVGGAKHLRAGTLALSSSRPVAFQVEGENVGWLPARLSVRPKALRVLFPAG
jgi:YegS/Rv2252/BmrU family lipid kinase